MYLLIISLFIQIECLFNIVNAIGKDLEQEVPDTLIQLYVSIRDVILTRNCSSSVKKILLHLVELRASKWTLPPFVLNYYNSKTNFQCYVYCLRHAMICFYQVNICKVYIGIYIYTYFIICFVYLGTFFVLKPQNLLSYQIYGFFTKAKSFIIHII